MNIINLTCLGAMCPHKHSCENDQYQVSDKTMPVHDAQSWDITTQMV